MQKREHFEHQAIGNRKTSCSFDFICIEKIVGTYIVLPRQMTTVQSNNFTINKKVIKQCNTVRNTGSVVSAINKTNASGSKQQHTVQDIDIREKEPSEE